MPRVPQTQSSPWPNIFGAVLHFCNTKTKTVLGNTINYYQNRCRQNKHHHNFKTLRNLGKDRDPIWFAWTRTGVYHQTGFTALPTKLHQSSQRTSWNCPCVYDRSMYWFSRLISLSATPAINYCKLWLRCLRSYQRLTIDVSLWNIMHVPPPPRFSIHYSKFVTNIDITNLRLVNLAR